MNVVSNPIKPETLFCGTTHIHLDTCDSTNSELQRLAKIESLPEGYLITTSYQTLGRGYAGNRWEAERDVNVLMSLLLKPTFLPVGKQFYLNQVLSLAVHDAFADQLKKSGYEIKWPNDLVADGKKICGMLVETGVQGQQLQYAVCGIGFNLNQKKFPSKIHATSLFIETGKTVDVNKAIEKICECIEARYLQLRNGKVELLQRDYFKHLHQVETFHDYKILGKKMQGKIVGLNPEGKLVLDTEDGFKVCGFKEVEYLR